MVEATAALAALEELARSGDKDGRRRGSGHPSAKLNDEAVRVVRRLLADGYSKAAIGRAVNVSPKTIEAIEVGRTWRHVR